MAFDFRREVDRAQENIRRNPKLLVGIAALVVMSLLLIVLNAFVFGGKSKSLSPAELSAAEKLAEETAKAQAEYERDNPAPPPPVIDLGPLKPK